MAVASGHHGTTLREIADGAGFSMADVAFLARLPKSTLSRLWDAQDWLDRVTGRSLRQLLSTLPGLAECVDRQSYSLRLRDAVRACAAVGLEVKTGRFRHMVAAGCSPQQLIVSLEGVVATMRLDEREAASYLARCWGSGQNATLDALLAPPSAELALLVDNTDLVQKLVQLMEQLRERHGSLQATVAHGILVHKLTKMTGLAQLKPASARMRPPGGAFAYRSSVIGLLLGFGDFEVAEEYSRALVRSPLLQTNELWSFATYSKDMTQTADFSLPRDSALAKTAVEVIADVRRCNEAYVYYLALAAMPVLLEHDPTFGGRREQLVSALGSRLETGMATPVARACATLAAALSGRAGMSGRAVVEPLGAQA